MNDGKQKLKSYKMLALRNIFVYYIVLDDERTFWHSHDAEMSEWRKNGNFIGCECN